ncbi:MULTISPECIES: 6-phosphogluconolactonase [Mumia]|uniref:6-phosphogluconolactonase n=1 Tax=Mumia TaxID=1546255 RepID=UPI0014218A8F|nr:MULTISPECIES: 6-phosphogluconolactonase [unclassified Mumia]QMW64773.1 6-phosphogluconolactonase [Mumia sp. ZJ1417]
MDDDPEVIVDRDPDQLARSVADQLVSTLAALQAQGRVPSVVLTGGTIADKIHRTVAARAEDGRVDWSRVEFFWGDERFVAPGSDDRNERQVRRALLDHLDVDESRVHAMPADDGTLTLDEAADSYADVVRGRVFDVVMLGVGPDGHVASLFPGKPTLTVNDRDTIAEPSSPKPPPARVSLTFAALNRGREVWFLVSGAGKADAVARALAGDPVETTPAAGVRGTEQTMWMLDEGAASAVPDALR